MPDPVSLLVGRAIRHRRLELGLSQETLASTMGISPQQLSKFESGKNRVSAPQLLTLSRTLQCPIGYLFDEAPPPLPGDQTRRRLVEIITTLPLERVEVLRKLVQSWETP